MAIAKLLIFKDDNPKNKRILVLAPTGVAAVSIKGTAVHSGLGINVGSKMFSLNDQQRASLRYKLSEVRFLIIDKISMVSQVLNEIFAYPDAECFDGLPIFVCGTFISYLQLT